LCHAPHSPFTSALGFPRTIRPLLLADGVHRRFESPRQVATSGASDVISPCFPLGVAQEKPSDLDLLSDEFSVVKARLELVQQKLIRSILNEQDLINRTSKDNFTPNSDSIARAFNYGRKTENISPLQESESKPTQRSEIRLPQNAQNKSLQHEVSTPIRNGCSDMSPFSDSDSPAKNVVLPEICWATQAVEIGLPAKNQNGSLQQQTPPSIYNHHCPFSHSDLSVKPYEICWATQAVEIGLPAKNQNGSLQQQTPPSIYKHHSSFSHSDLSVKATTPFNQTPTLDFPPGLDPLPFSDGYSPIKLQKCHDIVDLKSAERDEFHHGMNADARPIQNSYIQIDIEQSHNADAALLVKYDQQHLTGSKLCD